MAQGVNEQHKHNAENTSRMLKFHIDVAVDKSVPEGEGDELDGMMVTLHHDKLWIEAKGADTGLPVDTTHHPFTGFYVVYPDDDRMYTRGIVSTITVDPPMLNWIYADKDTLEMKYSNRTGSIAHHVGSFDWTDEDPDDSAVTLEDFEGFMAVEEKPGQWALYFDWDDDGLKSHRGEKRVVQISLYRRVIATQDLNKWGLKEQGNIGFKATKELDKRPGRSVPEPESGPQ